jgi:uncharacterized membrane protein YphA (DoxX/SURF4 family)
MDTVSTIAAIVLGAVFVIAGASKIASGRGWPVQARGLGAPERLIPLIPWLELVIGAGLVTRIAPIFFAVVAAVVLVAFTTLIVLRLREGQHPPCACFGTWSARPLGTGHVVRNVVLIILAVLSAR